MMLAAELTLAGADVAIVERRATHELDGSRAGGLHSRTIEVLDQRGVADRFLSQGQTMQVAGFSMIPLDISDFPTRHNYGLALWQSRFEEILAGWVRELGAERYRGMEVTGSTRTRPASRSRCPAVGRCGAITSSAATAAVAWSARRPGSTSRAGIRRSASWSPRWR